MVLMPFPGDIISMDFWAVTVLGNGCHIQSNVWQSTISPGNCYGPKKKKGSPETSPLSSYRSRSKEKVEQSGIPLKALSVVVTADACRFCQDRKTIVDLDISSQPLVIAIPCGFSILQAAP